MTTMTAKKPVPKRIGPQYTIDGLFQRTQAKLQKQQHHRHHNNSVDPFLISDDDSENDSSHVNDMPALESMTQLPTSHTTTTVNNFVKPNVDVRVKQEPNDTNNTYTPPVRKSLTSQLQQSNTHQFNGSTLLRDINKLHHTNKNMQHRCKQYAHMNHLHQTCDCDQQSNNVTTQLDTLLEPAIKPEPIQHNNFNIQLDTTRNNQSHDVHGTDSIDDIPISTAFRVKIDPHTTNNNIESHHNIQQYQYNNTQIEQQQPATQFQLFPRTVKAEHNPYNVKLETHTQSTTINNSTLNNSTTTKPGTVLQNTPVKPTLTEWQCSVCTYHNKLTAPSCEMCTSSRPLLSASKNIELNQPSTIQQLVEKQRTQQHTTQHSAIQHINHSATQSHTDTTTQQPYQFVRLSELRQTGQLAFDPAEQLPKPVKQSKSRKLANNTPHTSHTFTNVSIPSLSVRQPDTNNPVHYENNTDTTAPPNTKWVKKKRTAVTTTTNTTTSSTATGKGHWQYQGNKKYVWITATGAKLHGRLGWIAANKDKLANGTVGKKRKKSKQTKLTKNKRSKKLKTEIRPNAVVNDADADIQAFESDTEAEWQPSTSDVENMNNNNHYDDDDSDSEAEMA